MRILIVDDAGFIRSFLSQMVNKLQHDALVAESGAAALEVLKNDCTIRVVLTDLLMRDMDGVQLYQNARSLERHTDQGIAALPQFVLLTAARPGRNAQPREIDRINLARKIGFFDVVYKPIEHESLRTVLDSISVQSPNVATDTDELARQAARLVQQVIQHNNTQFARAFLTQLEPGLKKVDDLAAKARLTLHQRSLPFSDSLC